MRVVSSIIRSGYLWKFYHNYQLRHMKTLDKQQEIDFSVCLRKETKLIGKQTIVTEKEFVIPVISPSHCFSQQSAQRPPEHFAIYFWQYKTPECTTERLCVFRLQQVSCQSQDTGRGWGSRCWPTQATPSSSSSHLVTCGFNFLKPFITTCLV